MKLTVLGSGTTTSIPGKAYRYPAGHLLEVDRQKILLDSGVGILPQLANLGVELPQVTTICITHFHADHFLLEPILQAYFVQSHMTGKKYSLHILGPPGIEARVRDGYRLRGFTYDTDLLTRVDIQFSAYNDKQPIELDNGFALTPFKTKHYDLDAYALRLTYEDKILAYSGDSSYAAALVEAAAKADLFLCEAWTDIGAPENDGHLSAREVANIAKQASSKKVVLVHYTGNDSRDAIIHEVESAGYEGQVSVAEDLDTFQI